MQVSDVMSTNVVSIPSDTSLAQARMIMEAHKLGRLPVIDRGKLVGIVTRDTLDKMGPSQLTTFSVHEIGYLVNTIKVKEVMRRDVVTVPSTMIVEDAVALAQSKKVGILIVEDGDRVVGVATTTDFFVKILNPVLGIGVPGTRVYVRNCSTPTEIQKVLTIINNQKVNIVTMFLSNIPDVGNSKVLVLHLDCTEDSKCVEEIKKSVFQVDTRSA